MATRGPDPEVTDQEIFEAFNKAEKPFVTATDIQEGVDLSSTRIHQRLQPHVESGKVERMKVGNAFIYWLPDSGESN